MSKYYKAEAVEKLIDNFINAMVGNEELVDLFLSEQSTIEVSDDAISRAEFIEMIKGTIADATSHGISPRLDPHFVISMVKSAPSIIPTQNNAIQHVESVKCVEKPKEGEWIELGQNKDKTHNIRCKACGAAFKSKGHANSFYTQEKFRFCPNCGAKMKGADDE